MPEIATIKVLNFAGEIVPLVDANTIFFHKEYKAVSKLNDDLYAGPNHYNGWHNQAYVYQALKAMEDQGAYAIDISSGLETTTSNQPEVSIVFPLDTYLKDFDYQQGDLSDWYDDYIGFSFGEMQILLYNLYSIQRPINDENVNSIAVLIKADGNILYTAGDADVQREVEQKVVKNIISQNGNPQFMKLNHHGLDVSNARETLDLLKPELAFSPSSRAVVEGTFNGTNGLIAYYLKQQYGTKVYMVGASEMALILDFSDKNVLQLTEDGLISADGCINKGGPNNGWVSWANYRIDGDGDSDDWYYFKNNNLHTGWLNEGGEYYYLGTDYKMKNGWLTEDNKTYYLFESGDKKPLGAMAKGWQNVNGKYYLFADSGELLTSRNGNSKDSGWVQAVNGDWYYIDTAGNIKTGWLLDNDKWYYLSPKTGVMQTEWLRYKDNWYYLRPTSGAMVSNGWTNWNDKWYWLKSSGVMAENEWLLYKDGWYFLRPSSGAMISNGWVNWNDKWYWLKSSGVMAEGEWLLYKDDWYFLRPSSGAMVSNGWTNWNNNWYWLKSSGVMAEGEWLKYKDNWYYLRPSSGAMVSNGWTEYKDEWYFLKASGIMAAGEWTKWKDKWYWLKQSGIMAKGVTECENGNYYYLNDPNGDLRTEEGFFDYAGNRYYSKNGGVLYRDTTFTVNGKTYGATSDASLARGGWVKVGKGYLYYTDYNANSTSLKAWNKLEQLGWDLLKAYIWCTNIEYFNRLGYSYQAQIAKGTTWSADYLFDNGRGNCYCISGAFYYLAKVIGYDGLKHVQGSVWSSHASHGWCEVEEDGTLYIFDPTQDINRGTTLSYHATYDTHTRYTYNPGWQEMPF